MTTTTATPTPPRTLAPGPKGVPLLGNLVALQRKGMIQFFTDAWREYGDIVRFEQGPLVQHLIVAPDYVEQVLRSNSENYWKGEGFARLKGALGNGLILSEGDFWRRQRRLMQPPFTPRGVTQFAAAMIEATEQMLDSWERNPTGEPMDINAQMMRLAMNIIGRTMFNVDIDSSALEASRAFTYMLQHVSDQSASLLPIPQSIPTPSNRRLAHSTRVLDRFVYGLIAERRRMGNDAPHDLLTLLLTARDEQTGEHMSDQQVRDEVLTIFFAGHETTAQALTWAWYLLSKHPEAGERLRAEARQVLDADRPEVADLEGLHYASMVFEETMRLYPPVWIYARDAYEDDEIGGYHIPGGSMIMLSQYLTHRHPDYWQNPEGFDPLRFSDEGASGRHRFAYFPFGGGPRTCIGNNFAMLEAVTVLALVSRRYRMDLLPGQGIQPAMVGTLRPDRPVMMRVVPTGS